MQNTNFSGAVRGHLSKLHPLTIIFLIPLAGFLGVYCLLLLDLVAAQKYFVVLGLFLLMFTASASATKILEVRGQWVDMGKQPEQQRKQGADPASSELIDDLATLLRAVAEAAAAQRQPNVEELIANDPTVQAHFAALGARLSETCDVDLALVEYARVIGGTPKRLITNDDENKAGWPVFRRLT